MLGFSAIELGGLILIGYLAVFGIVNRICKCIEHCATGKAIREAAANGVTLNSTDISKTVTKEANNVEKTEK